MSDLVENQNIGFLVTRLIKICYFFITEPCHLKTCLLGLGLIFLILGLQIFFQNIKVGGGKKIKIKITKEFFFFFNLKHIWIREKKITKIV